MPGWKALPEELDPEVRAFTERIRRLIDRSGLGVVAVAERTGHERSAWDAYLNARRPVPRGAVAALAEVTGADPADLTARWERARGRFAPEGGTRAGAPAVGAPGAPAPEAPRGKGLYDGAPESPDRGAPWGPVDGGPAGGGPDGGAPVRRPADGSDGDDRTMQIRRIDPAAPANPAVLANPAAPAAPANPGVSPASAPPAVSPAPAAVPPPPPGEGDRHAPDRAPAPTPVPVPAPATPPRRRRTTVLLYAAAVLGALLVVTAALLLVDLGSGDGADGGADGRASAPPTTPAPSPTPRTGLPAGVECSGADCAGRDPEVMGCGGPLAVTVARARVGAAAVEVRHSAACAASWARITGAAPGDTVSVEVAGATERATVPEGAGTAAGETDAYTRMLAVAPGASARACGTLADGTGGCTAGR
ncbi:DUF2690 domain-containing protein [Streptomyces sp. NPDC088757]|uniref:helix-turn-helix domain-containing protein n=1 Tax=Streptomyces sp. NPDC088757 TaxID=3365889 RepID=UPI0037F8BA00